MDISELPGKCQNYGIYRFIVRDNGKGMSQEFLKKIFEPFVREEDSKVNKIAGTGLGMTIAKRIVDEMGGSITVSSELGKGSEFVIEVPVEFQDSQIEDVKITGEKVLVIDDYQSCLDSICSVLNTLDIESQCAISGEEGLCMLREAETQKDPFTCIMVDYIMPEINGIELAKQIRNEFGNEITIIMMSAYDYLDKKEEAIHAGINYMFTKPIFRSDYITVFRKIKRKRMQAEETEIQIKGYKGIHALLAEDNTINAEIAKEILEHIGVKVTIAVDGQEALDKLRESQEGTYDCIFMDIQMPVMNGIEAAREIRRLNRKDSQLPIFAMTANVFTDDIQATKEAGMQEHIGKPIDMEQIHKILNKWFRTKSVDS